MNILVRHPSVRFPLRLQYVLNYIFQSRIANVSIDYRMMASGGEVIILDFEGHSVSVPMNVQWLNEKTLVSLRRLAVPIGFESPEWAEAFFFYLAQLDRLVHLEYDEHGRWMAPAPDGVWPSRRRPFLDDAARTMLSFLERKTGCSFPSFNGYRPVVSVDVDLWYAYKGRGLVRSVYGLLKDIGQGRWSRVKQRINSVLGTQSDPYDTLSYISAKAAQHRMEVEVFVLPEASSDMDRQVQLSAGEKRCLLNGVDRVGLHPSYYVHEDTEKLRKEKSELESWWGREVISSRYHYLRGKYPESYQRLLAAGMKEDKTLIMFDRLGFANGTCHPHPYYDMEKEEITPLWIYPQWGMDVVLKDRYGLHPSEAIPSVLPYIKAVKEHGGYCSLIWHNSSFDPTEGWKGYKKVFEDILNIMESG